MMIEITLIVIAAVAIVVMVGYNMVMTNKKIDSAVRQLDKAFCKNVTALQGDRADLEAQSCGRNCGDRKPTSVINEEKLNRIGEKFYIKTLEDSQVQIEPCDCGDGCDTCQCAEDEQDDTEAMEEVADNNKEAAESITDEPIIYCYTCKKDTSKDFIIRNMHPFCSEECKDDYLDNKTLNRKPGDQDENHRIARERIASTKKAAQESIGGILIHEGNTEELGGDFLSNTTKAL